MQIVTLNEIAGFGVGAFLLCATIAAPRIDFFISSSQRRSLGMCKRCGDLRLIACRKCRGVGSVTPGGQFGLNLLTDLYESTGTTISNLKLIPCSDCEARGHSRCPDCS
ncbi:hypothetical protein Droror1_Dr00023050 [Drosera rotundifolia]